MTDKLRAIAMKLATGIIPRGAADKVLDAATWIERKRDSLTCPVCKAPDLDTLHGVTSHDLTGMFCHVCYSTFNLTLCPQIQDALPETQAVSASPSGGD